MKKILTSDCVWSRALNKLLRSIKMNQVTIKETSNLNGKEWFRVKDLSEILSMGESTIWKMVRNNNFPKPSLNNRVLYNNPKRYLIRIQSIFFPLF